MDDTIITTYYLLEEFLKATGHRDDRQVRLSTAEVMCSALVAAAFFGGNIEKARSFLDEYGYINKAISKSRFNRRLHAELKALGTRCSRKRVERLMREAGLHAR